MTESHQLLLVDLIFVLIAWSHFGSIQFLGLLQIKSSRIGCLKLASELDKMLCLVTVAGGELITIS